MQSGFNFENTFATSLEGFYAVIEGHQAPEPKLVLLNDDLAAELGIDLPYLQSAETAEILSGKRKAHGSVPLAQAYAGHQFGGFSPSLGDGRAMLLGEIIDKKGNRRDIQLKGSGMTPFSRNGDGKAALGPVLREYIISEAMHSLGIPTTRSLAVVTTGERVYREAPLPGAVLTRIAASHLRVGSFQFFAARGDEERVRKLADYAIARHYPELSDGDDKYLHFLKAVIDRQAQLVSKWMSVGFIHGVMNTDNMTISGETIDYGPCAFMDTYKSDAVFSSIDEMGRYAYRMQPLILQWNLARFAECLLALIEPDDRDKAVLIATNEINSVAAVYERYWLRDMCAKLGIQQPAEADKSLVESLLELMEEEKADFTITFRSLSDALTGKPDGFLAQMNNGSKAKDWLQIWQTRLKNDNSSKQEQIQRMNENNPVYIPRNHLVEEALEAAVKSGDYQYTNELLTVLRKPFTKHESFKRHETGAPEEFGPYVTFCGT